MSNSKAQKLFFPVFIYRVLNFLGLSNFPPLELLHIIAPIGATFLRQRQAHMKSTKPSTRTSKRPRGDASSIVLTFGVQPATKEIHVDPTATVDLTSDDDATKPTVTPPLSLRNMMESFMTTQAAHG